MIIYVYLLFHKAPQIIKIVILVNLSPIFLALALSILAWKFGKSHAFPTASKIVRPNQFVILLPQLDKTPQYHTENQMLRSFVKLLPFQSLQLLF